MPYDCKLMEQVIQKIRKEKGISQEVLSGLADIGRSYLAMIEKGIKNPNVDTLWIIAKAMDLPLSGLFQKYGKAAGEKVLPAGNENLR